MLNTDNVCPQLKTLKYFSSEIDNWDRPRFEFNEENEDGLESLSIYRQDSGNRYDCCLVQLLFKHLKRMS